MKRKLVIMLCALPIGLANVTPVSAGSENDGAAMIADVVIARPLCLAATAIGSAFFILSLPFSLSSKKVGKAAQALVKTPARATFTRPLGDFAPLKD
jgi:hypothetical protein